MNTKVRRWDVFAPFRAISRDDRLI